MCDLYPLHKAGFSSALLILWDVDVVFVRCNAMCSMISLVRLPLQLVGVDEDFPF